MYRKLAILICLLAAANPVFAQTPPPHSVVLTWTNSVDAAANPSITYAVYRLNGACPAVAPTAVSGSGFTQINTTGITTTTYTDSTVTPGTYCYFGTAFLNSTQSIPSNDAQAIIQPKPMTSFGVSSVTFHYETPAEREIERVLRKLRPVGMVEVTVPS